MWCSTCQCDCSTTGPADVMGPLRCAQCDSILSATKVNSASEKLAISENDWELEADLRSVQRLVQSLKSTSRIDLAAPIAAPHLPIRPSAPERASSERVAHPPKSNLAAWSLLSLGMAVFACGAVLLAWSLATGREDLWPLGMPLALAGQAALIVGLVLQLDGLWQSSRKTETTLSELDDELAKVRQATTLLSTSHSSPSQSFYLHMAEGASPQLLLADLKGQLDLLAQQMRQ